MTVPGDMGSRGVVGDLGADPRRQLGREGDSGGQHDEQYDLLAAPIRGDPAHGQGLGDLAHVGQRADDLGRADADAAHVEHAVAAAVQARRLAGELDQVAVRPNARIGAKYAR